MCCKQTRTRVHRTYDRNRHAVRLAALVVFACLLSGFIFSELFIAAHAIHEHDHSNPDGTCATCANVAAAESGLRHLFTALAMACIAVLSFASAARLNVTLSNRSVSTPVQLKVRLNN